ncbi:MAG TPA: NAD-dependent dehydratase, partial [Bacteroidetes bacterium]|nr:NAD-dependent dehydratase [Bacteroidota bacterium]
MTPRVFVTGGQGLVGKALASRLVAEGQAVRVSTRQRLTNTSHRCECVRTTNLSSTTNWLHLLIMIDTVVHCAARVHVMHDTEADPLAAFRSVNVEGTLNLARQAAAAGVKRFVFISSVKVNGESTQPGRAFSEADAPDPQDAYGQ